ncbi:MAG: DNA primase [Rhodanobacteraceae bacterium]|jgi:DNA primase|nr:DNA primase [Rhodanobacteraceae bacterium]
MAGRIPEKFIDDLLARIDIVDVIAERVQMRKAGRDWSARCPFHDERSPSFTVSPAKQFYHCFGCGAHGSAIGFLMNYDRLEFPDAVEELAKRAGLTVPYEGGRAAPREDAGDLYDLLEAAAKFYRRQLDASASARDYFARRGLDAAIIARFNLGYAPDAWDALKNALGTSAARIALLEKAGLLTHGERGGKYDRFRDRVMFPILDRRGRTIAFGGRILTTPKTKSATSSGTDAPENRAVVEESGDGPPVFDSRAQDARTNEPTQDARKGGSGAKYLNSPETPLFHKGRELFGLWQVREANPKLARLIVVEGYMDVISLHQAGVTQAVATLGTATTRDHAEILFRQCADVYFCFDGDRAGRQAAWRALESVLPRMRDGRQALFLFLPDGEDPDSLIRSEGLAGFEQRLQAATPLSEFLFGELGKDVNLASLDGKARLAERARPLLAQIPDGAFRDLMLAELDRLTGVQVQVAAAAAPQRPRPRAQPAQRSLVRAAITLLVQQPALAAALQPPWMFAALRQPGVPLLVELIELCRARPGLATGALLEQFAARDEAKALQKLAVAEFPGGEDAARAEFVDAIAQLERQTRRQRLEDLRRQQAEAALSEAQKQELRELLAQVAGRT